MEETATNITKYIIGPVRLQFLLLNPACIALGAGTAFISTGRINILGVCLALIGALCAHGAVNALNEYSDCKSGLDFKTTKTPFSGGSKTLPENPKMAYVALATGIIMLAITAAIGLYFAIIRGFAIIPLGIAGILLIAVYTSFITRMPFVCLIAPGVGFGTFMVMGTNFVLTGKYSFISFLASMLPFFLVNNLLLLNQFPDVEPDRSIGRKTLPIVIGRRRSSMVFTLFLILAYVSIVVGVYTGCFPKLSLLGLATIILSVPLSIGAFRYADNMEKLLPFLILNVAVNIVTPILVAVGMFFG